MGETGGRATLAIWNWLWGISPEPEPDAIAIAEASLRIMQESVQRLTQVANQQYEGYQQTKRKYMQRVRELEQLESAADLAQQSGRQEEARAAVLRAVQLEQFLPQLEGQVKQAEQFARESQELLRQERSRLEAYRSDLRDLKDLAEIDAALAAIAQLHERQDIESTRMQFEQAKAAVHQRYLERQAYAELLGSTSSEPTQAAEIDRRLQQLREERR